MKARGLCGLMAFGVWLILAMHAGETRAQAGASGTNLTPHAAGSGQVDLSDPKVRERLKASGVDPDELQKLMATGVLPMPPTGSAPASDAVQQPGIGFPPVTQPPGAKQAKPDTAQAVVIGDSLQPELKPYGYDIFTLKPATFEPLAFGPVSPDYLLGPGDEIIVSVWGAQEMNSRGAINREGFLVLPDIGQVQANGYSLQAFKEELEKRLSRIYSGISRDGHGKTSVDVSLGKLRSIQVFVLGDVVQPGGYTLSATSSVMNALYFAGGPTLKGSLRNVRVTRNNQVVHKSDMYDYVARGNRSQDYKLENGDVVFVPPVLRQVTLMGEVRHPAIFELKDGETLANLLDIAGGFTATAMRRRVQIERIIPYTERTALSQEDRKVLDLDLRGEGADVELADGDVVRIFRTRDILKNTVRLVGTAVYRPGTYQHHDGMTVADLVEQAGGLLGDAYTGWAHLVRIRDNKIKEMRSFDLAAALQRDPTQNLQLEERDEVQVYALADVRDPEHVAIQGLVRHPGNYEMLEGMTITDLVVKAGGLKESAYRMRAEVSRIDPRAVSDGKMAELLYIALGDTMNVDSEASKFSLQKNDIVFIREIPNWSVQENVWVTGEVKFPGLYSLTSKTERLTSIIDRAGGLEPTAYLQAASFVRKKDDTGRMAISFELALKNKGHKSNKYDLVMAAGDSINIPREPKTVKVVGDVGFPSSVLWEDGRDMNYYLDQAGGLLSTADKDKVTVVMASGRVERPSLTNKPKPDAGATIRVPRKPEQQDKERLKTMASLVSILSGAATTIYLISRSSN